LNVIYRGGVKCPKFTQNFKALIYRIIAHIQPYLPPIRGVTAGEGGGVYGVIPHSRGA